MNSTRSPLDKVRGLVRAAMTVVARVLDRATNGRLTPNMVTLTGLAGHVFIAWLIATRHPIWAAGLLIMFGLLDALDGALARVQKRTSASGMLLDSITDRLKEVLLYIGIAYFFVVIEHPFVAVWAVAACGASVLVSYVNAWAEAVFAQHPQTAHTLNQSFRSGLMSYDIRMSFFVAGLVTSLLPETLAIIAIFSGFTALGRVRQVLARL